MKSLRSRLKPDSQLVGSQPKPKLTKPTELRSRIMQAVRSAETEPETVVASWLKQARFKPLLNCSDLPGKPDLVLPRRKIAVFVHGCFWHGHACKRGARIPATNTEYWTAKISRNRKRDSAAARVLRASGWRVLTVWECQCKSERRRRQLLKALKR